ncbi:MAG: YggS family pyridoxal phosphate-dependent enzyme [Acidimicrobiia bacterium]|nr:YggS family pyridoxal phosphate-dependent enzyme [Acidimicrobiia bacterium]
MVGGLPDVATIQRRWSELTERVTAAGADLDTLTIVAVTKAFPAELVRRAVDAGLEDIGENYAQELLAKRSELAAAGGTRVRWHFIGGLQRNKVKLLAGAVHLWQTVDRDSVIDEIAKRSPGDAVLIQVNTTGEAQKAGCDPSDTAARVERARGRGLDVRGLMTIGPTSQDEDPRPAFARLRRLAASCEVDELSMGMSADYELAIAEGATMIRVGSVLFGPRPPR